MTESNFPFRWRSPSRPDHLRGTPHLSISREGNPVPVRVERNHGTDSLDAVLSVGGVDLVFVFKTDDEAFEFVKKVKRATIVKVAPERQRT